MTTPPPLPLPVPFPVYGLPGDGDGPRNLVLWNQPDWLWTITLAHGDEGDTVLVTTIRRMPRPPAEDDAWESPPNDLDVAALDAVTGAVERMPAAGRDERRRLTALLEDELDRIDATDDGVVLRGWDDTTVCLDGETVPGHTRQVAGDRVTVAGLPDVVVAIQAPAGAHRAALTDVRDRLAEYPWPNG